jgi:hypothetical protein
MCARNGTVKHTNVSVAVLDLQFFFCSAAERRWSDMLTHQSMRTCSSTVALSDRNTLRASDVGGHSINSSLYLYSFIRPIYRQPLLLRVQFASHGDTRIGSSRPIFPEVGGRFAVSMVVISVLYLRVSGPDANRLNACFISICKWVSSMIFESGSSLEAIPGNAFSGCKRMQSLCIPASVEVLGAECFDGMTQLSSLTFESGSELGTMENRVSVADVIWQPCLSSSDSKGLS